MYHPTALVESDHIGQGTRIWAFAHVLPGAVIGSDCNIGDHAYIESGAVLGDNITIKNGVCVWEGVELGDGVFVGPNAVFTNDLYPRSPRLPDAVSRYTNRDWLHKTVVETGATIGANATIICGITIGAYAFIGAGAVVHRDVPSHALMLGVPARQRGWVCRCGENLRPNGSKLVCCTCGFDLAPFLASPENANKNENKLDLKANKNEENRDKNRDIQKPVDTKSVFGGSEEVAA